MAKRNEHVHKTKSALHSIYFCFASYSGHAERYRSCILCSCTAEQLRLFHASAHIEIAFDRFLYTGTFFYRKPAKRENFNLLPGGNLFERRENVGKFGSILRLWGLVGFYVWPVRWSFPCWKNGEGRLVLGRLLKMNKALGLLEHIIETATLR